MKLLRAPISLRRRLHEQETILHLSTSGETLKKKEQMRSLDVENIREKNDVLRVNPRSQ